MLRFLLALIATAPLASAICYDIASNIVTISDFQPCNNVQGAVSMCCATNRGASSAYTPDTCLPNGLCQNIFTNETTKKPDVNYWRESCSSSGWNSKSCLKDICWGASEVDGNGSGNAEMTPCDDTATSAKWCCGRHNTACCGTGQEILLAAVLGVSSSSSSISTPTSTFSTVSPTSTATSSSTTASSSPTQSTSPQGLTTAAKAGIGIGVSAVVVAFIAVVGVLYFCCMRRRRAQIPEFDIAPPYAEPFVKPELPTNQDTQYAAASVVPDRSGYWASSELVEMQGMHPERGGGNTRTEMP